MTKPSLLSAIACLCIAIFGCSKQGGTSGSAKSAAGESPQTQAALTDLTKVLRQYSFEKRKLPQSLNEIVDAGYLQKIPEAPAGKKFVIDQKTVQVVLQKE